MTSVPGVKRTVGTKIPVAAVSGQRTSSDKDHWQQISPMPIAWGTPDAEVVTMARKSIRKTSGNALTALANASTT